ncbi:MULTISPECIES: glucosyl-dolichyl phosphate glucuronosyltransferase [Haloferax]|jgi:glycosyltransferase involved in cell wall biosynthesis|uniref:Glycosyltransferase n=4 Tax=Haloferax TaxID=2251 RepID=A0A6C0USV4_HALVO|nr:MULTISPECIES: glucosyl-dolichyl phosphate glucuronosyltransferase [Haloferax]ELK54821.1 glycosyltransferase AglG [Haloferax sp. BAB-2207]ELZ74569.1 glycosyltransferase AglG [Haloferax lucentense DSM 14919]ELZ93845.1 glycosyltransferase AglG [Haloferax alexandrinus JCM 10717]MBC9986273.1 glycosyltransferase family 2 protein [Haloferax sp. AS1]NLV02426.1 glycosyltransferase [Haloferax alexandrinus]
MKVSVVVCTYSMERYESFSETVESVLAQTYEPLELVIVVDGNEEVFDRVQDDFGDIDDVVLHCNDENRGISYSRTKGAELGTGDVVAMIDDDATAEPDWIETLVDTYENNPDAVAVGGTVVPDWVARKPEFFPEEFYWLVGCDERGFGEHMEEVRNTYGSNISFKRDVFLEVGGYDTNTGRKGDKHVQAHEAPVCIRIYEQTGERVIYNKQARVNHKLFEYRTEFDWLVFRSFWQGYSKRVMDLLYPQASDDKNAYLKDLMLVYVVDRLKNLVEDPSLAQVQQLIAIFVFTAAVGFGYVYGLLTPNLVEKTNN